MNYPIIDGHCDTALELYIKGESLQSASGHVDLQKLRTYPRFAQFFAFCPVEKQRENAAALYEKSLQNFLRELEKNKADISLCRNTAQLHEAWENGKTAAFLSIEGAEAIACDPGRLEEAKGAGISMLTLTWNYHNALGGSHLTGEGLTSLGRDFARQAQKLGIILDVSHLSDRGFYDLLDLTEQPLVASHSNSRRICDHTRNLTDEQFRLLAQTGGTAGLNLYAFFLQEEGAADFSHLLRHLEHFLEMDENAVSLGLDLDGFTDAPKGFSSLLDLEKLMVFLENHGFPPHVMEKICAGNLHRVMDACLK